MPGRDTPAAAARPRSAAELLQSVRAREWIAHDPPGERVLGAQVQPPLPSYWRRSTDGESNRFDGMLVADEVEIVDRWLAADGSHNVVVRAPDGETYRGRVEAWNPMNPLDEPIMMFRPCGGGGKRSFDMPRP